MVLIGGPRALRQRACSIVYGLTQHAGLGENVLDHRLNTRTVKMNVVNRFLYWNMNYHVEHHMFPMVPYHRLPELHEEIKHDLRAGLPVDLGGATGRSSRRSCASCGTRTYYVRRELLPGAAPFTSRRPATTAAATAACPPRPQPEEDLDGPVGRRLRGRRHRRRGRDPVRARRAGTTRSTARPSDDYYATDGHCTHEQTLLCDGLVMDDVIECPKHNGRFDYTTGKALGAPVLVDLRTYPVQGRRRHGLPRARLSARLASTAEIVIVGAGECGTRAALTLREQGWDGPVSWSAPRPSRRTSGRRCPRSGELQPISDPGALRAADISFVPGAEATDLDPAAHAWC